MRACLLSLLLVAGAAAQSTPNNVLVIVADDLGVDYVNAYGEGTNPPPTPTIDGLAARGVLFRNAWANPSCSPTRACIQTGRYPFRTMVGRWIAKDANPQNVGLLLPSELTLPEVLDLSGTGYAHALIGKWHLHDDFQSYDVPRTIGRYSHYAGSVEGQIGDYNNWRRIVDGTAAYTTNYCTIQNTDDALNWIQAQTGHWFCVLTYQAPHIPYHAPPAHLHTQNLTGLTPLPTTHTPANIPFYRAMVQSLDTEMGRLFATLGSGVMDQTNVIFIGDNGSVQRQSVAPFDGTRSKGTPYEGGVNVPLIVAGPAVQQGGREVTALACAVDVYETALELAGAAAAIPPFITLDSVSLVPYLTSPTQPALRQFAYTEEFTGTTWPAPNTSGHATIRDSRHKLIHWYNGNPDQVYDLQNDPWENTNLRTSSNPQVQAAYAALLAEINRLRGTGGAAPSFSVFGNGNCQGSTTVPMVSAHGDSTLGGTFYIDLFSAPGGQVAVNLFGGSWTSWAGVPLPFDLSLIGGGTNCVLSSSADLLTAVAIPAWGTAQVAIPVPNAPVLVDQVVFGAWLVLDNMAPLNPLGLVSTNSVAVTIGL